MKNKKQRITVAQIVTERIMEQLKAGTIPWHKPWSGVGSGAYSHMTGKPYSLINQMLLGEPGEYLTDHQVRKEGGTVKEGEEHGIITFYTQRVVKTTNEKGEDIEKTYPTLIYHRVYHIDQCKGIEQKYDPTEVPPFEVDAKAERIMQSYQERSGCKINIVTGDRASYSPSSDKVTVPLREQFDTEAHFYSTLFHEIGHSTGHKSRFNRFSRSTFGDEPYSREELVAEIIAASVMNTLGLETGATIMNTGAYIQSWLKSLGNDPKMIIWAASRAEKALNIITEDVEIKPVAAMEDEETEVVATPSKPTAKKPGKKAGRKTSKPVSKPTPKPAVVAASTMRKAAERFAKACEKGMKDTQPALAGAFLHDGRQFISNGHVLAVYDEPFAGLPEANLTVGNMGAQMEALLQTARVGNMQTLPDLDTMRKQFREAKAGRRDYKQITKLGKQYINTALLIQAMELAGVSGGTANVKNETDPMYIKGDGCETLVLPVRINGATSMDCWEPELSA